jgi:hypothetical protein
MEAMTGILPAMHRTTLSRSLESTWCSLEQSASSHKFTEDFLLRCLGDSCWGANHGTLERDGKGWKEATLHAEGSGFEAAGAEKSLRWRLVAGGGAVLLAVAIVLNWNPEGLTHREACGTCTDGQGHSAVQQQQQQH